MKIGELSEKTGLSRDTIRFYERNKLIESLKSKSDTNAYRDYPDELVQKLAFISQAREVGMAVSDLKDLFDAIQGNCEDKLAGKKVIQNKIEELENRAAQTRNVIQFLKKTLEQI